MTRKRLYAYHVIGFAAFCGTLIAAAPQLAPPMVGFAVIYLGIYAAVLLLGWLFNLQGLLWRYAGLAVMTLLNMVLMTKLGGPEYGIAAICLSLISYWPRRFTGGKAAPGNTPAHARA